jgi:salicylate hydroxylase
MDLVEPSFRGRYEKICVGNKPANAQHVFFEDLLLQEGLGMHTLSLPFGIAT